MMHEELIGKTPAKESGVCPECGGNILRHLHAMSTAVKYFPVYKDGVNINPDRNKITTRWQCTDCNHTFTETS